MMHRIPGLFVLLTLPVFGQGTIMFSGGVGGTRDGGVQGTATFRLPMYLMRPIAGAPYSGVEVHESVQTLADGTHITHKMMAPMGKTCRDSQGRVRMERSFLAGPSNLNSVPTLVQINDPVAGYIYILDNVSHVAHRITPAPVNQRTPGMLVRPPTPQGGPGGIAGSPAGMAQSRLPPPPSSESLGSKLIDGILTEGTRVTFTTPAGMQGNDAPITSVTETWRSPQLQLVLLTVSNDPRSGVSTTRFTDFSTASPDPALFMVPAGYTIVDETATFTIKWGPQAEPRP